MSDPITAGDPVAANDPVAAGDTAAETFLRRVQQRGSLLSMQEAEQVTRATLTALAEALSSGQVQALLESLPRQLSPSAAAQAGQAKALDVGAFLDRVGGFTSSVDQVEIEQEVRAVLCTVADWNPATTIADTLAQLPPRLADLFADDRNDKDDER